MKARRSTFGISAALETGSHDLVTGRNAAVELKLGRTWAMSRAYPIGMTRIGTDSPNACATPPKAFSAPGPCCIAKTPIRSPELRRAIASAMWSPIRSWRTMTGRMSARAACSRMWFTGYPMSVSTPSRLRISAIASAAFMHASPGVALLCLRRRETAGSVPSRWRFSRLSASRVPRNQVRARAPVGSYIARRLARAGTRPPPTSISNRPASIQAGVTASSART